MKNKVPRTEYRVESVSLGTFDSVLGTLLCERLKQNLTLTERGLYLVTLERMVLTTRYRRARALFTFGLLISSMSFVLAQGLTYTVQVAALSDQGAAQALQRELLAEGYPVYLVGVPTDGGRVYRLRVGAFGDRGAALAYAEAMRQGGRGAPVPALAEDVPAGLIPLEPTLLESYPYLPGVTRLTVVPWGEAYALRFQGAFESEPLEAEYRVLREGGAPFRAWRAAPFGGEGGLERVYTFPLWPPDWETLEASERDAYEEGVLETLAGSYGLDVGALTDYRSFEPGSGLPYLVRAERRNLSTGEGEYYPALGVPQEENNPAGPPLRWFGREEPEGFLRGLPEAVFDASLVLGEVSGGVALPPNTRKLSGTDWTASPDDAYVRLRLGPTGRNWRAVAGYPLWAHEDFLLVYDDGQVQLYRFTER